MYMLQYSFHRCMVNYIQSFSYINVPFNYPTWKHLSFIKMWENNYRLPLSGENYILTFLYIINSEKTFIFEKVFLQKMLLHN